MAVNTRAYGIASAWKDVFVQTDVPSDERLKQALFLSEPYPTSVPVGELDDRNGYELGNALWRMNDDSSYSIIDSSDEHLIDRSTTFVGIGGKSPYTKIRYISNEYTDSNPPISVPIVDMGEDEFDVVNTFFTTAPFGNFGQGISYFRLFEAETGGLNTLPSYTTVMWSPKRFDGVVATGAYAFYTKYYYANEYGDVRNARKIITQIPTKRIVWYPTITCSDVNDNNIATYDMTTYIQNYKTDKPRILSIQMIPVMDVRADITEGTTNRSDAIPHLGLGLNMKLHGNFDGYWIGGEGNRVEIGVDNPVVDLFVGCDRGVSLGGYITGKHYNTQANPILGQPTVGTADIQAIIDCGELEWRNWSGNGEGKSNEYLFCNANNYTASQIVESVRAAIACWGMFFADNEANAKTLELDDEDMFLGIIKDDGVGYGDYSHGPENRDQKQWDWKTMDANEYDPTVPPGPPSTDRFHGSFNFGDDYTINVNGIVNRHLLQSTDIFSLYGRLNNYLSNIQDPKDVDGITVQSFLTNNPIDGILGLQYMPVKNLSGGLSHKVYIGTVDMQLTAPTPKTCINYPCGVLRVNNQFGENCWINNLVKIMIYAPFCGIMTLDPQTVMGKLVYLDYIIDTYTGACTAIAYVKDTGGKILVVDTIDGSCSMSLPISGIQSATLNSQLYNAYMSNKQLKAANTTDIAGSVFNTVVSAAKGAALGAAAGPAGAIAGAIVGGGGKAISTIGKGLDAHYSEKISDYNLHHTMVPTRTVGAASSALSLMLDYVPKLIIYKPKDELTNTTDYGKTIGYACIKNGTLEGMKMSGYTEISNIKLDGIACTDTEKSMIASLCAGGVYV